MSGPQDTSSKKGGASQFVKSSSVLDEIRDQVDKAMAAHKDRVRQQLLLDAQENFYKSLGVPGQTAYARELDALQQRLTSQIAPGAPAIDGAVVLDPTKFDTGLALGLTPTMTVQAMIDGKEPVDDWTKLLSDHKLPEPRRSFFYSVPGIAEDMGKQFTSGAGTSTYTQFPTERTGFSGAGCVIVPASEKEDPYKVKGLSYEDNLTYVNLHESWHCRDKRTSMSDIDSAAYEKFKPSDDIRKLPDDPEVRKAYARNNQQECFADLAAVGEMIRGGKPATVLDAVMDWRKSTSWEVRHYTVTSLKAMQDEINKMGVDKFRKLDEKQAEAFYNKIVDDHALNARRVEIIQRSESLNPLKSAPYMVTRFTDTEVSTAFAFRRGQNIDSFIAVAHEIVSPSGKKDPQLAAKLDKWDASALLQDKAFAADHKITPNTLIKAYTAMQDELRARIKKDPSQASLYEAQMTKLQATFVAEVPKIDYERVNTERGVFLEDVEPSVKALYPKMATDEKKPKPSKPAGQGKVKL